MFLQTLKIYCNKDQGLEYSVILRLLEYIRLYMKVFYTHYRTSSNHLI